MSKYKPNICIYHSNCDDGFTAAWAVWKRWPDCGFVAGIYGRDPPDVAGKRVLMVDFSYQRAVLERMSAVAKDITILDHHKTAQTDLEIFSILNPVDFETIDQVLAGTQPGIGNIRAEFDMQRSGAMMAWQFCFPGAIVPRFVSLVQDRDLWRYEFGDDTKRFSAALRTYQMDFTTWDGLIAKTYDLIKDGEAVLRGHNINITKFIAETYFDDIGGHKVPVVNVPYHYASDTAQELLAKFPDAPFAACWFRRGDGMIQYSLRSENSRVDVSEVAQSFGRGGHRNAAGFQVPV